MRVFLFLQRIGRQHLVSYQQHNTGITVSSCYFDGTSSVSALCDNDQYWLWLFWGTLDEITLINNHVYNTAGRTPHAGGWSRAKVAELFRNTILCLLSHCTGVCWLRKKRVYKTCFTRDLGPS